MRFKWRRRLVVTAFALGSMLPFAGCSSQQQQASDEVAAEGQGSQEEGGQQNAELAATQGEAASEQNAGAEEASAQAAPSNEATAEENASGGENVVSNEAAPAGDDANGGDLQAMIGEMNSANGGQPAEEGAQEGEMAAVPTEAAPETVDAAPAGEASPEAATAEAAPVQGQPAAEATGDVAAPGMPEMGSKMAYVVEAGDTLGKIAAKIYGDQKRWRDIANLSGMENPNHIYPGDIVYFSLDDSSRNFAAAYESVRRAKEIVREGDTLAAISQRVYGTSKAWRHIWRQNDNIDNPDVLTAGMSVYYVEKGAFNAALIKVKSAEFAKVSKVKNQKVSNVKKTPNKANVTVQAFAFSGSSV